METIIFVFCAVIALLSFGIGIGQIFSKMTEHRYLYDIMSDHKIIGVKADSLFTSYFIIKKAKRFGRFKYYRIMRDEKHISLKFRGAQDAVLYINTYSAKNK